jgi:hypothetical protein
MVERMLILIIIVIVPMIPAFILYKFLPSETSADGPFRGLNIQLTGAFAGYFIVLVFMGGFFFTIPSKGGEEHESWIIEGKITLEQGQFKKDSITLAIKPPDERITTDGRFTLRGVIFPKSEYREKPSLVIHKSGYDIKSLFLEEDSMQRPNSEGYGITFSKKENKTIIKIGRPIILKKTPQKGPYSAEKGTTATPIE